MLGKKRYPGSSATHVTSTADTVSCRIFHSPHQSKHHIHVLKLLPWRSRGELSLQAGTYCFDPRSWEVCKVHWKLGWWSLLPCSMLLWMGHWKPTKWGPVWFTLTELEKGKWWAIPGFSTTFLAINENRSWIYMALSLMPGTSREDSLPILLWEGHLYYEQPKLILICQTLSHVCGSILLLRNGRELISKERLLCELQLWNCYFLWI